jgi:choice-of-anchor C domain-containing protein
MSGEFALAVGPNVLVDGDFSAAQNPGSYSTYAKGSHAIAGWTVTRATVDLIGTYWTAPGGRRSVDLDGTPGFGAIAQTFRTLPGAKYVTSFLLSANGECPPPVKRLRVSVGPAVAYFSANSSAGVRQNAWPAKRVTFVATRRLTTLEFASMDAVGGDCGPVVAAISVRRV